MTDDVLSSDSGECDANRLDEGLLSGVIAAVQSGIAAVDCDGRQILVNDAFCRMVGWSRRELLGATPPFVYWPPEQSESIQRLLQLALQRRFPPRGSEVTFARRDGSRFDAMVFVAALQDVSGVIGWVANVVDISDIKSQQAALRQSEARLNLALEASGMGSWVHDPSTGDVEFDDSWIAVLGYSRAEYGGSIEAWADLVNPDDRARVQQTYSDFLAGRSPSFEAEFRMRSRDGTWRWIDSRARMLVPEDGSPPVRVVGTHRDITRRKRDEEALRRAERIRSLGDLSVGIAHDFNNLLGSMVVGLELAAGRCSGDPEARRWIDAALAAALGGRDLTNALLNFSGRVSPERSTAAIDLNDAVARLRPLLDVAAGRGIHVHLHCCGTPLYARVDPGQFDSALMNLVMNAREAMCGRGDVTIRTRRFDVDEEDTDGPAVGAYALVEVADGGPGIEERVLERAFEPYFTTRAEGGGTGLGLSMVAGFCRAQGGRARIASERGAGTTVSLFLPLQAVPEEPAPVRVPAEVRRPGRRVLVVDDDEMVNELVRVALSERGCQVESATSLPTALELLKAIRFDVVVTDVQLHERRDGYELADWIHREQPAVRVVLVSGVPPERTNLPEIDGFLLKPFRIEELVQAVMRNGDGTQKRNSLRASEFESSGG